MGEEQGWWRLRRLEGWGGGMVGGVKEADDDHGGRCEEVCRGKTGGMTKKVSIKSAGT
jgi:hypothetical protein